MRILRVALALVVAGVVLVGLSRISFDVDILKLLPVHLKQVEGLSIFLEHFARPNEMIVTVEGADPHAVDVAVDALTGRFRSRPDLVRRAVDAAPWEERPQDLGELIAGLLLNQPPEKIAELRARLSPESAPGIARATVERLGDSFSAQEIATSGYDPFGLGEFLFRSDVIPKDLHSEFSSADGTFRVIYVETAAKLDNYKATIAWARAIKALAATVPISEGIAVGFTGEPGFVADISGSMQGDMMSSAGVTLLVIALIFWLCYRRFRPLLDLVGMLLLTFVISMGLAGFFLRELTVIGVGFASIMIGLSVDYGYLIYQKSLRHGSLGSLRRESLQNIMWTAGTTAAAFFALNLSSLPGLSQLGNLVGIGVCVGATVMLTIFARITQGWKKITPKPTAVERLFGSGPFLRAGAWFTAALVIGLAAVLVLKGGPRIDATTDSLRPRHSGSHEAMDRLYVKLADDRALLSLIVTGRTDGEVLERLQAADAKLREAVKRGDVKSFHSALTLWPNVANQRANLPLLGALAAEGPRLERTLLDAGFSGDAFLLTKGVLERWAAWSTRTPPIWPDNEASRWILRRVASVADGRDVAMGVVRPADGREDAVVGSVQMDGVYLVSWGQLARELRAVVPREFERLIGGLVAIVLVLLLIAFRSIRDVGLLGLTMTLVFVSLAGALSAFGMSWNFFNLAAILLLLGTGVDYSILLLLALRRNGGDVREAQRSIGLVVGLCAMAAAAGFGTIGWANNRGLASLGITCSIGLALDALISIFLLPVAWRWVHRRDAGVVVGSPGPVDSPR